jgi:Fe-S-cluster-containing dehydrogenase component
MKKWTLIIDVARCHDCNNCFLACKDEYWENDHLPYSVAQPRHGQRWIDIERKERGQYPLVDVVYLPKPCMHCHDPACVKGAGGAVYQREDGIVLIDPEKARGKPEVASLCPYGLIWWNDERQVAQKCTLCAHLLDEGWSQPRCVQACPTGALSIVRVTDDEMQQLAAAEQLEIHQPEHGTRPRTYFKNLYRFTRCFVAGSVATRVPDECAEGAAITLKDRAGKVVGTAVTHNYGDFRIDNLPAHSGEYTLEVAYSTYPQRVVAVKVKESVNVGVILL